MGKAFTKVTIGNNEYKIIAEHSGGSTNPKTREVPDASSPGSMRREPTGGDEREDLVLTALEREDEGILLEPFISAMQVLRDADPSARRVEVKIEYYRDKNYLKPLGFLSLNGAYPYIITPVEGSKSSDDPREVKVTFTHLGSKYTASSGTVAAAPTPSPTNTLAV